MRFLANLSINAKLNLLVVVASGVTLLLASAVLLVNNAALIRSSKIRQLTTLANVLGANSTAALTFDDPPAAKELLSSLSLQQSIQYACLFNAKGRVFASYYGQEDQSFVPAQPGEEGHAFLGLEFLDITQSIVRDRERVGTIYLRSSMNDLREQMVQNIATVVVVMLVSMTLAILAASRLQRVIAMPILSLARTAQSISTSRDYSLRVTKAASDEVGTLYDNFNAMLDEIERGERELQRAHDELELRVQQRTSELSQANLQLSGEIAERKRAERELETVHQQLVDTARRAGMAEVANGVLHNVGNVLNSINVSATLLTERLRNSKLPDLTRALDLIEQHAADLGIFLTQDDKGRRVPPFLRLVASHLDRDRGQMLNELQSLTKNVDHVKTIIAMQQSYAGPVGLVETVSLADLVDDALKLNASSFTARDIRVVREYADLPEVRIDKQKVLQILMNLFNNAKDALLACEREERRVTARIRVEESSGEEVVLIEVIDNGTGIPREDLKRIFSHGFTTKRHGHGFGLHSSANAAKELGGELRVHSEGLERGAVFTLELPFKPVEVLV